MLTLVIGGARSGKTRFAQSLSGNSPRVAYLATCQPEDDEMEARVDRHRKSRPAQWRTIEERLDIAEAVERLSHECEFILLDCLTLWLSNLCWTHRDAPEAELESAMKRDIARVAHASKQTHLVAITNELGCGLVPESAVGRRFRDLQGWMNQDVACAADQVYHLVAGIPSLIKTAGGRQ